MIIEHGLYQIKETYEITDEFDYDDAPENVNIKHLKYF